MKWATGGPRTERVLTWTLVAILFLLSLWLRRAFPIFAFANAVHDDLLFVQLAAHLRALEWLGPYDQMTHAKGAAFSAFMALNQWTGLPLKTTEHWVYLLASLAFSATVGKIFRSNAATLVCFLPLAFNPLVWAADVGGRVVRENLYGSLTLLVLALSMRVFAVPSEGRTALRAQAGWLVALGVVGATFWLTREEGVWLAPAVLVLAVAWIARAWRGTEPYPRRVRDVAAHFLVPALAFVAVVGAVNSVNYLKYGVFRNNDFRSADFQRAYGALSRIAHDRWRSHIVFPRDARGRAYAVSPAARELQSYFEGQGGANWVAVGCEHTQGRYCDEIHVGWFMWALRDAVAHAGHYRTARDAQRFYRRLGEEIDQACNRREIPCGDERETLVPTWHPSYLPATAKAASTILHTLVTLAPLKVWVAASIGTPEQIALFARMTNGPLATAQFQGPNDARKSIAEALTRVQKFATSILLPASLALWMVLLAAAAFARRWHPGHVVVASLVAALAMRVGLLSFLEATSIPSNNLLYLSPAVPLALALAPCVAFLLLASIRDGLFRRAPRSAPRNRSAT